MTKKTGSRPSEKHSENKLKKRPTLTAKEPRSIKRRSKLPSAYKLSKAAFSVVWQNKGLFAGITLVYGLLNLLFVQGIAGSTDASSIKHSLDTIFSGSFGSIATGASVFAIMLGSAGSSSSQVAGAYQTILVLIGSLAMIWALRQVSSGIKLRVRDPYYKGLYPLVPFVLVLLVVGIQLLPVLLGSSLYSLALSSGLALHAIEQVLWASLFAGMTLLSLWLISSSIFALYIVTLPDMTPMKALRSARELVRGRRWIVLRKILCLPLILLLISALIMIPVIIWLTPLSQWLFFVLTMLFLLAVHAYMYTLYRELLNE